MILTVLRSSCRSNAASRLTKELSLSSAYQESEVRTREPIRFRRHRAPLNFGAQCWERDSSTCSSSVRQKSACREFGTDASAEVILTQERLDQLLEAEITTIALQEARPLTLQCIMETCRNAGELAALLHEELPVRYARRIAMIESLPDWQLNPSIANVQKMYVASFKELRMVDPDEPEVFRQRLKAIKQRHLYTNLLVLGFKHYAQTKELSEKQINEWLDRFFALRISTNLLISQYIEMFEYGHKEGDLDPYKSSVCADCNAVKIARHAAAVIQKLCEHWYGCSPEIQVTDAGAEPFTFVPRYLFYILSELLKNSVRAVVEHQSSLAPEARGSLPPVQVVVSSGADVISIRISDEGGGIAVDHLSHVWSYLYTTAKPADVPTLRASVDAPTDLKLVDTSAFSQPCLQGLQGLGSLSDRAEEHNVLLKSPLAGLGCGLPLSRLYAQYLGGRVVLHTLPRFGTDVFIYLNSLGNTSEVLKSI